MKLYVAPIFTAETNKYRWYLNHHESLSFDRPIQGYDDAVKGLLSTGAWTPVPGLYIAVEINDGPPNNGMRGLLFQVHDDMTITHGPPDQSHVLNLTSWPPK